MTTNAIKNTNHKKGETLFGGEDKIKRYKWNTPDEPGEFVWIDKAELYVDHAYQRGNINELRINEMAANWDWVLCGALSVSIRDDKWYVMDGQHRKLGADKRSDIKKLPCMVFNLNSQQHEASAFVGLNRQKTAINGVDHFKAMVVSGDEIAIRLKSVLDKSGYKITNNSGPKNISCIKAVWRLFSKNEKIFMSLWPLITAMTQTDQLIDILIRGIFNCEMKCNTQQRSLTDEPYRGILIAAGGAMITAEIRREVGIVGFGGPRIECAAIIKWINRQKLGKKQQISAV
jgi:hypothetical protein